MGQIAVCGDGQHGELFGIESLAGYEGDHGLGEIECYRSVLGAECASAEGDRDKIPVLHGTEAPRLTVVTEVEKLDVCHVPIRII